MEFIIELILDIVGEIADGVMKSKKTPRWVRMLVYTIVALTFSALMLGIAYIIYEPRSALRAVLAFLLAAGTIVIDVWGFIKAWNIPKGKDDK